MNLPIHTGPLKARRGAFKPCRWCQGDLATFDNGKRFQEEGPAAKVICEQCGRQIAWANAKQVRKAAEMVQLRPPA